MTVTAIVPAGGAIDGRYAEVAGTTVRCLAPLGPGYAPVLGYVAHALRDSPEVGKIVVAAPQTALRFVEEVDEWRPVGRSGPESIKNALDAVGQEDRVLICTSDLPFLTGVAVSDFIRQSAIDKDVSLGLVRADRYEKAFPNCPPSTYVSLRETGPVTMACLFLFSTSSLRRSGPILEACFASRKSLMRTAALLGPAVILRLLLGGLSLHDLVARGTSKTGLSFDILTDVSPQLAFDIDTVEDYEYANAHLE